jgi:hypothetical protein
MYGAGHFDPHPFFILARWSECTHMPYHKSSLNCHPKEGKKGSSLCKMGSADLHGLAAPGVNLLPHAAPLQMYTMTPFIVQSCLKRNI